MKPARNAIKGYTYQYYVFSFLLAKMDTERSIKRIISEATDTEGFDDIYVEMIEGKEYRLQVKNYMGISSADISVDSNRNIVSIQHNESEYNPDDNNVFVVNALFDGTELSDVDFLGIPAIKKENIMIVPLPTVQIESLVDDLFQQEIRKRQIANFGYRFICSGVFEISIEDLPPLIAMPINLNQETIMLRGVPNSIPEGVTYIVGKPGVGKSHYVNELTNAFPKSIVYRFWIGQQDPNSFDRLRFSVFLEQIGLSAFQSPRAFTCEELIQHLIEKKTVLIIDGLDHVENYNPSELQQYYDFISVLDEKKVHAVVLSRPMKKELELERNEMGNWTFEETSIYLNTAYDIEDYSLQKQFYGVAKGYPIITYYLAEHYKNRGELNIITPVSGVFEYYETLLKNTNIQSLLSVFTVNNSFFTYRELANFLSDEYYTAVSSFIAAYPYLFDIVENRIALIHDSFNTYLRNQLTGYEMWKNKILPIVSKSILSREIEFLARFSSFDFEEGFISRVLEEYSDFDTFEYLLKNTIDYDSISVFYDQLRLILDTHPGVLDVYQYYAFSLIYQSVTRNELIGYEGLVFEILVYINREKKIKDQIFSSAQIWNVYLACRKKQDALKQYLINANYGMEQFESSMELIEEEISFFDRLSPTEKSEDVLAEIDRCKSSFIEKTDLIEHYLVLIWIKNDKDALFYPEFKAYLENGKEGLLYLAIQEKYFTNDEFWIRQTYSRAKYRLHELGCFGEKNLFYGKTLQNIIQDNAPEGSFELAEKALSYLRLANHEEREVDIYCVNYVWNMYAQKKDYSVYTIPTALITFESKGLLNEDESIEIITRLMKQSEKGIRHLLASYINMKGPSCVRRLVNSGRIYDHTLKLDYFDLLPECINELPDTAIDYRLYELMQYHGRSMSVNGSDVRNVLHSKYSKQLCDQLSYYNIQIMNSLSDEEIEIVKTAGIDYIPDSDLLKEEKYEPFRYGHISREDFEYIKTNHVSAMECAKYTDGWYTCLPFVDLYDLFDKKEIQDQYLVLFHHSLFAKVFDNRHFGFWYSIIGNIPAFLDRYEIPVDWEKLFGIMLRFLDVSVIYYPQGLKSRVD